MVDLGDGSSATAVGVRLGRLLDDLARHEASQPEYHGGHFHAWRTHAVTVLNTLTVDDLRATRPALIADVEAQVRREVAEEIAAAIEDAGANPDGPACVDRDSARIAREAGERDG